MSNTPKRTTDSLDAQVGQAWSHHYNKQNEVALAEFRKLAEANPSHIDANFGYALSLKTAGDSSAATDIFHKTLTLVDARIGTQSDDDEDSRYRMLKRMIEQHLGQIQALQG